MKFFSADRMPATFGDKCANLREMRDLYAEAFPKSERRAFSAYETVCRNEPGFVPYTLRGEAGEPIGLFWYWETEDFVYLEHFAIEKTHRNGGLGAKILAEFMDGHPNVVLEAEDPVDDITRRRIGFYQRCGMIDNGFAYENPGYWTVAMPHRLRIVSSRPMTADQCRAFAEGFIKQKPLAYIADPSDDA